MCWEGQSLALHLAILKIPTPTLHILLLQGKFLDDLARCLDKSCLPQELRHIKPELRDRRWMFLFPMTLRLKLKPVRSTQEWLEQIQWFYFQMRVHDVKKAFMQAQGLVAKLARGPIAIRQMSRGRNPAAAARLSMASCPECIAEAITPNQPTGMEEVVGVEGGPPQPPPPAEGELTLPPVPKEGSQPAAPPQPPPAATPSPMSLCLCQRHMKEKADRLTDILRSKVCASCF